MSIYMVVIIGVFCFCVLGIIIYACLILPCIRRFSFCSTCRKIKIGKKKNDNNQYGFGHSIHFKCKKCNKKWQRSYWSAM